MFYKDEYSTSLSISNMILKSRFFYLLSKLKLILNLNCIFNIQFIYNFILLLNDFFLSLFEENFDFILYLFFFNKNKFFNIQNNTNN